MARRLSLSRRAFLTTVGGGIGVALLGACSAPAPSRQSSTGAAPTTAPPAVGGALKQVVFWGRQQFLPESVKSAAQRGGFDVGVQLFTNDEHPQKEVGAMESGVVPDITYTYAPALWNQNGHALEVRAVYDEVGKSGGAGSIWPKQLEDSYRQTHRRPDEQRAVVLAPTQRQVC